MAVEITSGDLKHKVVFKQPASSLNDEGGKETTYTNAILTWAKVEKFNQYRTTEGDATALVGSLDFYVRYNVERSVINKDWLISYNGKDYTIHQIEPIEQKQMFIRFTAKLSE
jgi:SPP1 family predicted phage head-tail adaptor